MGQMAAAGRTGNKYKDLEAFLARIETSNSKCAKFKYGLRR